MPRSTRAAVAMGAACGLAVGSIVWVLFLAAEPLSSRDALLVAAAAAAGAMGTSFRGRHRPRLTYPVALGSLLVSGPAASCLSAAVASVTERLRPAAGRGGSLHPRLLVRASRVTVASGLSAWLFVALGGSSTGTTTLDGLLAPLAAHALCFVAASLLFHAALQLAVRGRVRSRRLLVRLLHSPSGLVLGAGAGAAVALALGAQDTRPLVLAVFALATVWAARKLHAERGALERAQGRELRALDNAVTRALARIMEERDPQSRDRVRRVYRLSLGVGTRLGLTEQQLDELGTAALLHDIGTVSIPDRILEKPDRLSVEEAERVRRHVIVGAEIVGALPFAGALPAIVRHHHERWDGAGYPDGLAGEAIPFASRILAAVDCYDALTSDRPYRPALSHREATAFLERQAGAIFDPAVASGLLAYLDSGAGAPAADGRAVPEAARRELGAVPDRRSLARAQREIEMLYDLDRSLRHGLALEELLTLTACRLASHVTYRSLVVYTLDEAEGLLRARFAAGRAADQLKLTTIPLGQRVSGCAAAERRALRAPDRLRRIARASPRPDLEEWGADPELRDLEATLAAPLVHDSRLVGVITLYDRRERRFTDDERRILVWVAGRLARAAAFEGEPDAIGRTSLTDPLTGLPNARFLWLEAAHRASEAQGFGLVAFRLGGLEPVGERSGVSATDRLLCETARRFAAAAEGSETVVRFGEELFLVLTPPCDAAALEERSRILAAEVERPWPAGVDGVVPTLRLMRARAACPADGAELEHLLQVLDERLLAAGSPRASVLPFRRPRPTSAAATTHRD